VGDDRSLDEAAPHLRFDFQHGRSLQRNGRSALELDRGHAFGEGERSGGEFRALVGGQVGTFPTATFRFDQRGDGGGRGFAPGKKQDGAQENDPRRDFQPAVRFGGNRIVLRKQRRQRFASGNQLGV